MYTLARYFLQLLTVFEKVIAGVCLGALTLLMGADVAGRELTNDGIEWAQKASILLMIWGGFLGVSLTSASGQHLRPEIADKLWPSAWQNFQKRTEQALIAAFCVFFFWLSLRHVMTDMDLGDSHPVLTGLPIWAIKTVFPYVFLSLAIRHTAYTFFDTLRPANKNESSDALEGSLREET